MNLIKNKYIWIIFFISLVLGTYRLFPYFSSLVPLGYDPGLYRFYFLEYFDMLPTISFSSLSQWSSQWEPMLGLIMGGIQSLGVNVDFLLTRGLGLFSVLTCIPIYFVLKKHGKTTGLLGIALFLISITQYQTFGHAYYKQIIAIIFLLVVILLLQNKRNRLSFPMIVILFTLHRPTGLFFVLLFVVYKVLIYAQDKTVSKQDIFIVCFAGFISLIFYWPLRQELILSFIEPLTTTVFVDHSGTFFSKLDFLKYDIIYILITLFGLYYFDIKKYPFIFSGFIVGLFWTGFSLFFYNRIYVLFDVFLILYSAIVLGSMVKSYSKSILLPLFCLLFFGQGVFYLNYISDNTPLISQDEFEIIKKINTIISQDDYVMVTHKNYSPWLIGYVSPKIIAPGLFEYNKWNLSEWKKRWSGDGVVKCEMLNDYVNMSGNLYIWKGAKQPKENLDGASCLTIVLDEKMNKLYKVVDIKGES